MSPRNVARLFLLGLSCFASLVSISSRASAESSIRAGGHRPPYSVELEPHLLFTPFEAPDISSGEGFGLGVRATIELAREGFIPKINDSVGLGFGLDWIHYNGFSGRAYCRRFEYTPEGVAVCVETSAHSSNYIFVPVVMQWNFWLHRQWSVFGEPGLAITHHPSELGVVPVFNAGGRFHLNDAMALTLRVGYPSFSLGFSLLF